MPLSGSEEMEKMIRKGKLKRVGKELFTRPVPGTNNRVFVPTSTFMKDSDVVGLDVTEVAFKTARRVLDELLALKLEACDLRGGPAKGPCRNRARRSHKRMIRRLLRVEQRARRRGQGGGILNLARDPDTGELVAFILAA